MRAKQRIDFFPNKIWKVKLKIFVVRIFKFWEFWVKKGGFALEAYSGRSLIRFGLLVVLMSGLIAQPVTAQYSSPNYKVEEAFFGTGGELDPSSPNYKAQQSAGGLGVGFTSSANYDAFAGFVTPNEPFLAVVVNAATIDLGLLSTSSTASGSGTFSVRTYLSSNYVVKTMSPPPTNESGNMLDAMPLGAPVAGVEQFGINLIDNSNPDIGANPVNVPDASFADGNVASDYGVLNQFKYLAGDTIAQSPNTAGQPGIGQTNYTISYVANASAITEAGLYSMAHQIVVVATY